MNVNSILFVFGQQSKFRVVTRQIDDLSVLTSTSIFIRFVYLTQAPEMLSTLIQMNAGCWIVVITVVWNDSTTDNDK